MNDVIIVGAGGLARELVSLMRYTPDFFVGFLSDTKEQIGQMLLSLPVLGTIEEIDKIKYSFVCGVGSPALRKRFVSRLGEVKFVTLNPFAEVRNHITFGMENIEIGRAHV
jgi:FlaA1/EpsC-like NDP-sugar epimerase